MCLATLAVFSRTRGLKNRTITKRTAILFPDVYSSSSGMDAPCTHSHSISSHCTHSHYISSHFVSTLIPCLRGFRVYADSVSTWVPGGFGRCPRPKQLPRQSLRLVARHQHLQA